MCKVDFGKVVTNLKKFDMKLLIHPTIVVIGYRASGKSTLIKDILFHTEKTFGKGKGKGKGIVVNPIDHLEHFYDQFIPEMLIHKKFDTIKIDRLLEIQRKARHEENSKAFVVLDNAITDKDWRNESSPYELFYSNRHYKITTIVGIQTATCLPPELRAHADYVFIFKCSNYNERKKLYENYASRMIKTFEIFCSILDAMDDYRCLVIVNTWTVNINIGTIKKDKIFYYKAEKNTHFTMLDDSIWFKNNEILYNRHTKDNLVHRITKIQRRLLDILYHPSGYMVKRMVKNLVAEGLVSMEQQ